MAHSLQDCASLPFLVVAVVDGVPNAEEKLSGTLRCGCVTLMGMGLDPRSLSRRRGLVFEAACTGDDSGEVPEDPGDEGSDTAVDCV